jgi:hypothetical protein
MVDITVPPGNQGTIGDVYPWEVAKQVAPENFPPGSPEWWLHWGLDEIQGKQAEFRLREDYVRGNHPLPNSDRRFLKYLRDFQYKAKTNFIELVTHAPVQRMRVKDFRFGDGDSSQAQKQPSEPSGDPNSGSAGGSSREVNFRRTTGDKDARRIWMANDMDYQMEDLLMECATFGESYLLVGPQDPETGEPVITTEHPRCAHVFYDPIRPTRALAGLRLWQDVYLGNVVAVLYLPDAIYTFQGPPINTVGSGTAMQVGQFSLIGVQPNEAGEVPLIRVRWKPDGTAEAQGVYSVQDRMNQTVLDRLVISKSQAYRQRWVTGGNLTDKAKRVGGKVDEKPPFDPGSDILWHIPAPDAKFGDFDQADITQILSAIRDDILDIIALTQTPAHYLMGRLANVSGDTLTQAESGFVAKIKMRQRSVGWAIEKALRIAFKIKGDMEKATAPDAEVVWADPEVRALSEKADSAIKISQAFAAAPPYLAPVLGDLLGFDPDQIEMIVENAEKWQQQQLEREKEMFEAQAENAVEIAKMGGRARPPQASGSSGSSAPSKGN